MKYIALLAAMLVASAVSANAGEYPERPITWIVPFAAGGVTDNTSRVLGALLAEELGKPVVVENKPGAGGIIGTEAAARSKPDGYTVLYATGGPNTILPNLQDLPYDPQKDFIPVRGVTGGSQVIVATANVPYNTIQELVEYAKGHPGEVNFGSPGIGTAQHLVGELFKSSTGADITHIPYKAGTAQMVDLMAGVIDISFDYTPVVQPYVQAGKLKVIGTTGPERQGAFPDAPTMTEAGYPKGTNVASGWMAVPAGTDPAIVARLSKAFETIMSHPTWIKWLETNSQSSLAEMGPDDLPKFIADQLESYRLAVEVAGLSPK